MTNLPTTHYHYWNKKTEEYQGTTEVLCDHPLDTQHYIYEEYTPPPMPASDGWYLVSHRTGTQDRIFVLKEGTDIKNVFGKVVSSNWEEYTIVARIPHVEWVDGLPSF